MKFLPLSHLLFNVSSIVLFSKKIQSSVVVAEKIEIDVKFYFQSA